jgi:hypothetical protein
VQRHQSGPSGAVFEVERHGLKGALAEFLPTIGLREDGAKCTSQ